MVSKKCEYAIRAVLFIAQRSHNENKVGVKEIAIETDSPESFIAKILQELSKKGIVLSAKGPKGGFYLDAKGMKHSLADIVQAIDGDKLFKECGLGLKNCSEKKPCPIHDSYVPFRKQMKEMLAATKVIDVKKSLEIGEKYLRR